MLASSSRTIATHTPSFLPLPSFILRQISSNFSPFNKMPKNNKAIKSSQADSFMPAKPLSDASHDNEEYIMVGINHVPLRRHNMKSRSLPFSTKSSARLPSPPTKTVSEYRKSKRRIRVDLRSVQASGDNCGRKSSFSSSFENTSSHSQTLPTTNFTSHQDESLQHRYFGKKKAAFANRQHNSHRNLNNAAADHKLDSSVSFPKFKPFDICFDRKRHSPIVGFPLLEKGNESCIEMQDGGPKERILRPGMALLKHYIAHDEQVEIVKICRELGVGPGGFYQPGYADGAKLRLQMMCLGLDWDPQTRKYGNRRIIDGSEPPSIPDHFSKLVLKAIQQAHYLIKECGVSYVEDVLPSMSPDICIVNFYTTYGRLGLHQDRDESRESLRKGLPVVSFSIGDSAEFLYGDQRDVEKAESVLLESGDVLIFGGKSRHVLHGVSSIIPDSAPNELLKDTSLRPGRLNLTFRQY